MGKGVFARFPAVAAPADNAARAGDHSAYGHFPLQHGEAGKQHRFPHTILIRHGSTRPLSHRAGGRGLWREERVNKGGDGREEEEQRR